MWSPLTQLRKPKKHNLRQQPAHYSKVKNYSLVVLAVVLFSSGAYLLWLTLGASSYMPPVAKEWNEPVSHNPAALTDNRIYIPKLLLNLPYKTGDQKVLRDNAWHRFPERGDPEKGGNFILAGHRFEIGLTPGETKRKSPFYYINKLVAGDKIYVDFNGKRYAYEVSKRFSVQPTQVEIEAPSTEPKMTLYTCTLKGSNDGREVITARLIQRDVDPAMKF